MEESDKHLNIFVDLSHHNKNVNFTEAKQDGISAVILKATEGLDWVDPKYAERKIAAEKENMLWGAYHFGTGSSNGTNQAKHFLRTAFTNNAVIRAILDIEINSRGKYMSVEQAEDFVRHVQEKTGRLPLIYGSAYFLEKYNTPLLTSCPLWIASYTKKKEPVMPKGWNNWYLWQYTDGVTGAGPYQVKGIGRCDRSKLNAAQ